ncbi:hypothetical protein NIES970_18330 [[Synechococcus] sp. NIES-970]|nr:hypothetical protein NIES970_18330 [[Synechococcus] sp. NIES-970]
MEAIAVGQGSLETRSHKSEFHSGNCHTYWPWLRKYHLNRVNGSDSNINFLIISWGQNIFQTEAFIVLETRYQGRLRQREERLN